MKQMVRVILGCAVSILVLASGPGRAQTTANGPYYATPAWDQKLDCTTMSTCPRFIVLLNWSSAAVLDRETGLVWEQSPSTSRFPWSSTGVTTAAATAAAHCNQLNVGNRKGWRLPTIQEQARLVGSPSLPAGHPFSNVQSAIYWSATTLAANVSNAWIVGLGASQGAVGDFDKSASFFVWCVRGGQGVDPQ